MKTKPMTDFENDLATGAKFWLGPITRTHQLGRYQLIEYREIRHKPDGTEIPPRTMFTGYVDERRTSHSHSSIEAAIAKCIVVSHNGYNDQADEMFMRMLRRNDRTT